MEGIGYWIILAVIYLVSALFKKRQQQDNPVSDSPSKDQSGPFKSEFLQDMFGDLKEIVGIDEEKDEDGMEGLEYFVEDEEVTESIPVPQEHDHVVFDDLSNQKLDPMHEKYQFWNQERKKTKGINLLLNDMSDLKRAIVLKEVLDKPLALRRGIR